MNLIAPDYDYKEKAKKQKMKSLLLSYKQTMKNYKSYVIMIFIQCTNAGLALMSKASVSKGMNPCVFVVFRQAFASLALVPFVFIDRFFHCLFYILTLPPLCNPSNTCSRETNFLYI